MTRLPAVDRPLEPNQAECLIADYSHRLADYRPSPLFEVPTLDDYRSAARDALAALTTAGFVTPQLAQLLAGHLDTLDRTDGSLSEVICHGDLGPNNIMAIGSRPIAIDWEDMFLGVPGYDYLYWLTFMQNRPALNEFAFGRGATSPVVERALLVMIVLLKGWLSVLSGQYRVHRLSIASRLSEVLDLAEGP